MERKRRSTSSGSGPANSANERSSRNSSSRCCRSAGSSPARVAAIFAYRRTARRSRIPVRTSSSRERRGIGSRNGKLSTGPLETIFPFNETAARRPGNRLGADAEPLEQPARDGLLAAEDVRAEVQPDVAARLATGSATHPVRRLEHDDITVAELVRRREPGDATADDDDLSLLRFHQAIVDGPLSRVRRYSPTRRSARREIGSDVTVTP